MPVLGIAAELSAPPSSPTSFREVCLWSKVYRGYDVVAISPTDMIDPYSRWFRIYGLFDYVDDLLVPSQAGELTIHIEGGPGSMLTCFNVRDVLSLI